MSNLVIWGSSWGPTPKVDMVTSVLIRKQNIYIYIYIYREREREIDIDCEWGVLGRAPRTVESLSLA